MGNYGYLWSEIKTESRIQQVGQGEEKHREAEVRESPEARKFSEFRQWYQKSKPQRAAWARGCFAQQSHSF